MDRLGRAEIPLQRIHTVVVTHSHPDHFGGAARLRAEIGAAAAKRVAAEHTYDHRADIVDALLRGRR